MSSDKKEYAFKYVGKIVMRSGKNKESGEEYSYMMLQMGERMFQKGEKKGQPVPPVILSDKEKAKLLDMILEKDLYLFNPNDDAPDFIKKYVAVKTEDIKAKKSDDADL